MNPIIHAFYFSLIIHMRLPNDATLTQFPWLTNTSDVHFNGVYFMYSIKGKYDCLGFKSS